MPDWTMPSIMSFCICCIDCSMLFDDDSIAVRNFDDWQKTK